MSYLTIQEKEDSAEKLALAEGKPTKNFLFAPEFNTIVSAINTLRQLIQLNSGNITAIMNAENTIDLGEIEDAYLDVFNSTEEIELTAPVFVTYTNAGSLFIVAFVGQNETYGTTPNLFLTESDFIPIYDGDIFSIGGDSNFNLSYLSADLAAQSNVARLYAMMDSINFVFANSQKLKFIMNDAVLGNGSLLMPFSSGRVEISRPSYSINSSRDVVPQDYSRILRISDTDNVDLNLTSNDFAEIHVIKEQISGIGRITMAAGFTLDGTNLPLVLQPGILYKITRVNPGTFLSNAPQFIPYSITPAVVAGSITINFDKRGIYNSNSSPSNSNITNDLTNPKQGIIQKIYHNNSVAPTYPGGWVRIGGEYKTGQLNIIFAEWCGGSRVEYWITQQL